MFEWNKFFVKELQRFVKNWNDVSWFKSDNLNDIAR